MTKSIDINPGDKFGKLTVVEEVERWVYPSGETRRQFVMQCECGSPAKRMLISNFKTGSTKSCGCYNREQKKSHGMHDTRQYQIWADMKTRCDNPDNKFYAYYGGRGITYCDKWKTFEGFWEDMKASYSDALTLNRRDNDDLYCKENCEWDTKNFQGHMRRKLKGTKLAMIGGILNEDGTIDARIKYNAVGLHLGKYATEEEAMEAYDYASYLIYGDRPNKTVTTRDPIKWQVDYYWNNRDKNLTAAGERSGTAKLTANNVLEIVKLVEDGMKQTEVAAKFNVLQGAISSIMRGATWSTVTGFDKIPARPRKRLTKEKP